MKYRKRMISFLTCFFVSAIIWAHAPPNGLDPQAWKLFAVFTFTILGIILQALPMGAMAFIGLALTSSLKVLPLENVFSGFQNPIVWLVVGGFFMARGFIKTGLGIRMAYKIIYWLGESTLGMAYGLIFTDFILAPALPSITARTGGVVYPIAASLCKVFGSDPDSHPRKLGAYFMQAIFQGSTVTSGMFLTSMAGNPLVAELAKEQGIIISWGKWALAAIVPGLISLSVIPYILFKIYPPQLKKTENAKRFAKTQLRKIGPMKRTEWILLICFILLLLLWIFGSYISMSATTAILLGISALLITGVITWSDLLQDSYAWDTLTWFATLIMFATYLGKFGFTTWISTSIASHLSGLNWVVGFCLLAFVYFYSHYLFASNSAHIGAMYAAFLVLSISLGTPPLLAALALGFISNLFGGLTQYGSGPAPILFGAGYVNVTEWWKLGFIFSIVNICIWGIVGAFWWKLIGIY